MAGHIHLTLQHIDTSHSLTNTVTCQRPWNSHFYVWRSTTKLQARNFLAAPDQTCFGFVRLESHLTSNTCMFEHAAPSTLCFSHESFLIQQPYNMQKTQATTVTWYIFPLVTCMSRPLFVSVMGVLKTSPTSSRHHRFCDGCNTLELEFDSHVWYYLEVESEA